MTAARQGFVLSSAPLDKVAGLQDVAALVEVLLKRRSSDR
jgi:hypothetical protein